MPRGVKRSEIEIVQSEILAAEKKREKNLQEAAAAKKAISKLQDKIEQQYAREIAKACRASGLSLEAVLNWVKTQQAEAIENGGQAKPAAAAAKTPVEKQKRKPAPRAKAPRKTAVSRNKSIKSEKPTDKPKAADVAAEPKE